ncbi:MAG TPA: peptide chain release factor H [Pseudolabrys sp.]|nr:peptide chain release factor H [Pseudolabrys sp.]
MTEIIIHLSSGQGPEECRWVIAQLARIYSKEATSVGCDCELLEPAAADPASLLLRVTGQNAHQFVAQRTGTILWTGTSPFRPNHKRRNWFVGSTLIPPVDEIGELREEDVRYQSMRASGPGGQHVNKTDSAIRATHVPTGFVTTVQDQRSQHANRKLARIKLALMLMERRDDETRNARKEGWDRNRQLERGNPVRTYIGSDFKLKRSK